VEVLVADKMLVPVVLVDQVVVALVVETPMQVQEVPELKVLLVVQMDMVIMVVVEHRDLISVVVAVVVPVLLVLLGQINLEMVQVVMEDKHHPHLEILQAQLVM
tara:strand:+ start:225 stop:536 length:312 start_codon:yes stop_codon:yes gene_type:complete